MFYAQKHKYLYGVETNVLSFDDECTEISESEIEIESDRESENEEKKENNN